MHCKNRLCKTSIIIIALMIIFGFSQPVFSQRSYSLEIFVGDTLALNCPDPPDVSIPIYMKNYADTVAGFSLWLHLDRPDIMEFQTSLQAIEHDVYYIYTDWFDCEKKRCKDSVVASPYWVCLDWDWPECLDSALLLGYYLCTDYSGEECIDSIFYEWIEGEDPVYTETVEAMVGNFDTVGTLISGWEFITARSLTETGLDMLITAYADQDGPPPDTRTPGIGPQYSATPLIKILGNFIPIDDTVTNRSVAISIEHDLLTYFDFTNESGVSLCVNSEQVERNSYFMCHQWLVPDEVCMYWSQVHQYECPPEGCDSIHVDTLLHGFPEVDKCCDPTGENCLTEIEEWQCSSQFGGTGIWHPGSVRIIDGSFYIEQCKCGDICGDFNDDGWFNILDIIILLNYIYKDGPQPTRPCIVMDVNNDGVVNILDIICLINFKYKFGNCCDGFPW